MPKNSLTAPPLAWRPDSGYSGAVVDEGHSLPMHIIPTRDALSGIASDCSDTKRDYDTYYKSRGTIRETLLHTPGREFVAIREEAKECMLRTGYLVLRTPANDPQLILYCWSPLSTLESTTHQVLGGNWFRKSYLHSMMLRDRDVQSLPERKVVETLAGRIDHIVENTAYVSLETEEGKILQGQYPLPELQAKGIGELSRFEVAVVEVGNEMTFEFSPLPIVRIAQAEIDALGEKLDAIFGKDSRMNSDKVIPNSDDNPNVAINELTVRARQLARRKLRQSVKLWKWKFRTWIGRWCASTIRRRKPR